MVSREVPIDPAHTALLFIDVQNYTGRPDGANYRGLSRPELEVRYGFFFQTLERTALPNMQRLQTACRQAQIEVLYTVIENLTQDGRDRSLDYKISGLDVPKGSWDARVLDAIAPVADEIIIPKTSSSVFISTNIDYVLRNLGVRYLLIAGMLTDQCVDSAVRDACDLGYLVTVIT
ncbi:MAG: cysteine hydrolase, partial [Acetobacteraceae bacterium]|nr:cysteine hydrolase [Acetobacteraceae bacterium]